MLSCCCVGEDTPSDGLYERLTEAQLGRVPFSGFRVGVTLVKMYERVGKSVIVVIETN